MRRLRIVGIGLGIIAMVALAVGGLVFRTDMLLSQLEVGPLGSEAAVAPWTERVAAAHGARAEWLAQGEVELTVRGELTFFPVRLLFGTSMRDPRRRADVQLSARHPRAVSLCDSSG